MSYKNKFLPIIVLLLLISSSSIARSPFITIPGEDQGDCGCQTSVIDINTGVDHSTGITLPAGSYDPMWVVTTVPASSGLSVPAIPYVITPSTVWGNATPSLQSALNSSAGWLSPFNTASYSINNPAPDDPFIFRLDFCVCLDGDYLIDGMFDADDEGQLWLDGTTLIANSPSWNSVVPFSVTTPLSAGGHFLELHLRNTGAQVMGIAMSGTITSTNGSNSLIGYDCCSPKGGVNGRKYLDRDCDGKISGGDDIGAGWQFTLNPGGYTATTDVLGYFNFPNIPPGTYTLSEVVQPGWHAVTPASGSTTVVVTAGGVVTVDFLNSECEQQPGCDLECYWRVTGNNAITTPTNYFGTNTSAPIVIKTNSTQRAVIEGTGDGNFGIATPTPTTILDVYAAPPPAGAPSGLRFEDLPDGEGYILVVDDQGYVYRSRSVAKSAGTAMQVMQMEKQIEDLKQEINTLKAAIGGSDGNSLSVSPNPTDGQVNATYKITGAYSSAIIRITDISGKTVLNKEVTENEGVINFSINSSVASGNLICTLIVDGKISATQKLVLNRQ